LSCLVFRESSSETGEELSGLCNLGGFKMEKPMLKNIIVNNPITKGISKKLVIPDINFRECRRKGIRRVH
jgi:hypothetical protein